ncbi:phage head closure protein [Halalkalibacter okhensis]|uniref:Phage head-tail adapter protein n=1 Tax=Halalkalibacter okhensis TaxID=333138 RepID=A0A0B0IFU6_9BACI|nr:phage head closure protein [Halalkalibacter okhensis]KHF41448.1 phage head-tail adapter protein [Halalkalibacter okhensis]
MSFGKMRTMIDIIQTQSIKDEDGFTTEEELTLASTRAYKEDRHGNEAWKNRASFSTATSLFRFRKPHDINVTTALKVVCRGERYNILSVEDLKERGMYLEVLAEKIVGSKG